MIFIFHYLPNVMDEEKIQRVFNLLHITDVIYLLIPQKESDYNKYKSISYNGNTMYNFSKNITIEDLHNDCNEKIISEIHKSFRLLVQKVIHEDLYLDLDIEDTEHQIYHNDSEFYCEYKKYIHLETTNNIAILTNVKNIDMRYFYDYSKYYIKKNISSIKKSIEWRLDPEEIESLEEHYRSFYPDEYEHIYTLTDYWKAKKRRMISNRIIDSLRIELVDFIKIRSYTISQNGNKENFTVDPNTYKYYDSFFNYLKDNGFSYECFFKQEKQESVKKFYQYHIKSAIQQENEKQEEENWINDSYWNRYYRDSDYQNSFDNESENEWNVD